jgi:molecular chaperone GrpE
MGTEDPASNAGAPEAVEPTKGPVTPMEEAAEAGVPAAEAGAAAVHPPVEELARQLKEARNKAEEHWNQLLRVRADLDNQQRRMAREVENAHKYGLDKFVQELLPVKDSLERGLRAFDGEAPALATLREGVELTARMLHSALEKFGVKEVDPAGEPFNPELHAAMTTRESGEVEPGTVLEVFQKGYRLNDRLIRAAMVVVSKAPSQPADTAV